jgi:hypothetical protein
LAQNGRPSNILDNQKNLNVPFGGAYPLDMFCHPLNFLSPEFFISEGVNGTKPYGKFTGVWKLSVMLGGDGKRLILPDHQKPCIWLSFGLKCCKLLAEDSVMDPGFIFLENI